MKTTYSIIIALLLLTPAGCKKFVEAGSPETQLAGADIFNTDATATAAQLAIYSGMESDFVPYNWIVYSGLAADEFTNYYSDLTYADMASNNLTPENASVLATWTSFYEYIYQANNVLEGVAAAQNLSANVSRQLQGEARFIRAFFNFYLVNLFGDIPLVKSTDYRVNAILFRSPAEEVYDFIEDDLNQAITLLSPDYMGGKNTISTEKVRPNKWAATALLARVQLYRKKWQQAETQASGVIAANYKLAPDLNMVFLKNSDEAIWQLMAVRPQMNSSSGASLILTNTPSIVSLDTNFIKSFQPSDNRRGAWTNSITVNSKTYYYPYKYKVGSGASSVTEYTMVLRLSEQYLIRAEARAMQNNLDGGLSDLNVIRNRAGLSPLSGLTQQALVDSIQQERRYELFTEFGDRWLNLNRTGMAGPVLTAAKGPVWTATDKLHPIPQAERNRDINLTQNPGY